MLYEAFLWGSEWLEVWLSSVCCNKLPTHVFAFGNLPKSAATLEEGPGGALLGLEGSWSTREGLEKNVLQIYPLRASVVLPAPNTIQFLPIYFCLEGFRQEWLAKRHACYWFLEKTKDTLSVSDCFGSKSYQLYLNGKKNCKVFYMTNYSGVSKTEKGVIILNVCQNKEYISLWTFLFWAEVVLMFIPGIQIQKP